MTDIATSMEILNNSPDVYEEFRSARSQALVGAEDDMWAMFADIAEPHALLLDNQVIGCCSIDEANQLHAFHIDRDFETSALAVLAHVIDVMKITAAITSTVDPAFLSLGLSVSSRIEPVGLMYEHVADSEVTDAVELRIATAQDHSAVVSFNTAETGSLKAFLDPYLAERITKNELYLMGGNDGRIIATGECRVDTRAAGNAHLGLVVGTELRGQGIGGRLMQTLVKLSNDQGLIPLCSTEPANIAAQRVIHRTGFRTRHRILRLTTAKVS